MSRKSYFTREPRAGDFAPLASSYDEQETRRAWEGYVAGETARKISDLKVRDEILQSWQRSSNLGVNANNRASRKLESIDVVENLRRQNLHLSRAARSAFARLSPHLTEAKAILILTDRAGVIIEAIGDRSVLEAGREICLEVGGIWNEDTIGTNGIGTALRTGKPTYVHASEHFCEGIKAWTCAGVPIFDPFDKSVLGVVDLSGPPDIFRRHNIALVVAAAREIEIALAEQQKEERTRLLEAFVSSGSDNGNSSVVLLDKVGRILFRRGVDERLTGLDTDLSIGKRLLNMSAHMTDAEIAAALPKSLATVGINLLQVEGSLCGAALFLNQNTVPQERSAAGKSVRIASRPGVDEEDIVIVGAAAKMLEAVELAQRAAEAGVTVLIHGETGVGKELFARLIHGHIGRKNAPYIAVNCAAISGDLIGAELFGHVEGAFTGAVRGGKPGKFELADTGVLCLDEIGDMPVELQPYLLRALEQRAVYRIGDSTRRPVDVQLVAMTNRNLREDIEAGRFRRDLFYRIGTIVIDVPALRDREGDVDLLLDHFNDIFAARFSRGKLQFPDTVRQVLREYRWPGNVRELRNLVERLHLLKRNDQVTINDLPAEIRDPQGGLVLPGDGDGPVNTSALNLENVEAMAIQRAMQAEGGNMTRVAQHLGISRPTLYRKIRQYNIPRP